jgi:hypothetical protein
MHGKTSTARQASTGGHARHVGTTQRAATSVHGDLHNDEPSAAVRIPPFTVAQDNSWARQWPLQSSLELGAFPGAVPCARLHARQMLWEWRVRRKLHLMRIGDCVRACRLPGPKMRCDLPVQRRSVSGEANGWLGARGADQAVLAS